MGVARLTVNGNWESLLNKQGKTALESVLPDFLRVQRWFGGKGRPLSRVELDDSVELPHLSKTDYMAFVKVHYAQGQPDTYALPLAFVAEPEAGRFEAGNPQSVVAQIRAQDGEGALVTPLRDPGFCRALLDAIAGAKTFKSAAGGEIRGVPTQAFQRLAGPEPSRLEPSLMRAEQSNSSILYGERLILKVFRRLDEGVNPDLEVGDFLTKAGFAHIPAVGGALEYRRGGGEPVTLGILQDFVPSEGDAWGMTLDSLSRYYERVVACAGELRAEVFPEKGLWEWVGQDPHPEARKLIGTYLEAVGLLGRRTAELHLALASNQEHPAFAPEPFSPDDQRALYESMRNLAEQSFRLLERRLPALPEPMQEEAARVHALQPRVLDRLHSILERTMTAMRTRVHGDYHLGQVLYTGSDFVMIDFEGEPARPISERRTKRSPLQDVAGMLRSFHYAAYGALLGGMARGVRPEDFPAMELWADRWYTAVSSVFMTTYLKVAAQAPFLPRGREELRALLDAYRLDKAIYEMAYELNNRPDWLRIPLHGIRSMMEDSNR